MARPRRSGPRLPPGFWDRKYFLLFLVFSGKLFSFLQAENFDLLKDLINTALEEHVDFRKFKYFPLDPEYVTNKITGHKSYTTAVEDIKHHLRNLSDRLKNSVPFFSFRSQGHMLWDTTIASNVGYIAALLYNQNNVASMAR